MAKASNLIGQKFGRLTVIERLENTKNGKTRWLCKCDCGNETIVQGNNLKNKHVKSCGCLNKELTRQRNKKYNKYDLSGEYGIGYTSKGEPFYFDLEDYDKIKNYCWYINESNYVRTRINKYQQIYMHQLVLSDSTEVDHIHGELSRNNNRKENLRPCTHQENMMNIGLRSNNTSGATGVFWVANRNKWKSEIIYNNKIIRLGYFNDFEEAVKARKDAEEKYFGEFSYDNSQNYIRKE